MINSPYEFRIRRRGIRDGKVVVDWYPMAKCVANAYRYAEVSLSANQRYLDALAVVDDPQEAYRCLHKLADPVKHSERPFPGFNPASKADVSLFAAVMGLRNRDVRQALGLPSRPPEERRRASARVSRLLKRLHVHGLIAKVPRSRRWRPTKAGQAFMSLAIRLHDRYLIEELMKAA